MRELEIAKEAAATKMEEIKSHPMQLPPAFLPLGVLQNNNSVFNWYTLTANRTFIVNGLIDKTMAAGPAYSGGPSNPGQTAVGTIRIDTTNIYLYEVLVTIQWTGQKGRVGTAGAAKSEYTVRSLIAQ